MTAVGGGSGSGGIGAPGRQVWRRDAATRLESLLTAQDRAGGDGRGDAPTPEAYQRVLDGEGGQSAAVRDARWADAMLGYAVVTRLAGDLDAAAATVRRLDRALDPDDPLRIPWSHCRALNLLAQGDAAAAATAASDGLARSAAGSLEAAALLRVSAVVAQARGDHAAAVTWWDGAVAAFEGLGLWLAAASGRQRRAAARALLGGAAGAALVDAVDAIDGFDAARYRLRTVAARDSWIVEYSDTIAIALELAAVEGHRAVQVELIERARTQVSARPAGGPMPGGAVLALDALTPIAVHGAVPTRGLRAGTSPPDDAGVPIDLDVLRRRLAGDAGWWWGSWRWRTRTHWVLLAPDGRADAGWIDADDVAWHPAQLDRSPAEERAVARRLGAAVLPPPLVAAARAALAAGGRLRVAVAPSQVTGGLPLAVLAMPDGTDDPCRLIEAADLCVAPSAAFLAGVGERHDAPSPIRLVVADPQGDLPVARRTAERLSRWSAPPGVDGSPSRDRVAVELLLGDDATLTAVRDAVARHRDHAMAVLAHVGAGPMSGVLRLAGGAPGAPTGTGTGTRDGGGDDLDAVGLWTDRRWRAAGFPRRVLLATCSGSGLDDLGDGSEWLGLAPAMLQAGSATVVTTTWPQIEHPATERLDGELAAIVATATDPVVAVGDCQRAWLRRWRATGWTTCAEQAAGAVAPDHAGPRIWAGIVVVTTGDIGASVG